jgi:hypothetical protein
VGVLEFGRDVHLLEESLDGAVPGGELGREDLERHLALHRKLPRQIDLAHPPFPQRADDLEACNPRSGREVAAGTGIWVPQAGQPTCPPMDRPFAFTAFRQAEQWKMTSIRDLAAAHGEWRYPMCQETGGRSRNLTATSAERSCRRPERRGRGGFLRPFAVRIALPKFREHLRLLVGLMKLLERLGGAIERFGRDDGMIEQDGHAEEVARGRLPLLPQRGHAARP